MNLNDALGWTGAAFLLISSISAAIGSRNNNPLSYTMLTMMLVGFSLLFIEQLLGAQSPFLMVNFAVSYVCWAIVGVTKARAEHKANTEVNKYPPVRVINEKRR